MVELSFKAHALAVEAQDYSVLDMWRARSNQAMLPRIGKTALGAMLKNKHVQNIAELGLRTLLPGYEFIGMGCEQAVYKAGQEVVKLYRYSYDCEQLEQLVADLQAVSTLCGEYLGELWVRTDFEVYELPTAEEPMIIARQPFIQATANYKLPSVIPSDTQVTAVERRGHAENIRALHEATGLYPDLLGANNFVGVDEDGIRRLRIVDTIAVSKERQEKVKFGTSKTIRALTEQELDALAA